MKCLCAIRIDGYMLDDFGYQFMIEGTICLQCGDKGFENALVHCVRCLKFAVHRYCLDKIPDTFDEFVCWFCDDCKVKVGNQSAVFEHDAIPCQTRHHKVSKNIKRSSRDEKEKNGLVMDENEHVRKDELDGKHDANATLLLAGASENVEGNLIECRIATSYDECVKVGIDECTNSASDSTIPCIVKENGCSEQKDQEEKMIENKKKRKRPREKNIMELMTEKDQHRLANTPYDECVKENGCSEQKDQEKEKKKITYKKTKVRQRQRKRTQAIAEKEQHRLATTTYDEHTKVDINEGTRQGNDSTLPSKVKANEGCELRDQTCITKTFESITDLGNADHLIFAGDDQEKKRIKNRKTKVRQRQRTQNKMGSIAKVQHRLHTTTYDEHIKVDINEGMRPGIDSTLPSSMKENESYEQKDQTKPFKSITDHPVISSGGASKSLSEKKKVLRTCFPQPLHAKELADLSPEEKDLGSSDGRIKSRGPEDKVEQISTSSQSKDKYVDYSVAQPIAMPVWRGSFNVRNSKHDSIDELVAHISNKACHKVYAEASQFQPILHLEMLPKSDIWPKSFQKSEPNSDSIALYFFPSKIRNQVFAQLVQEMIHKELAFKGLVQNAELLIFTSTELPLRYWSKLWFLDVM
ncbi:hypothetical protein SASPL_100751 [Salvia splendens]|uniref:AIPP2-like SPOC-like domain-containing protein n=1 Tax=Salvia splendens TaxID=180675 RepID=A0A8X8YMY5_SALSN|nr:hypothetical protein SASPL_100751 [Salvia splendens]